ncbi:MAG: helix-turn-helix transcriptional regulator [archaeon]|nr:helix-turn-helix transcriptional regulator [archaeon]
MKKKTNNPKTTYDRMMKNPKWKAEFEKGYEKFLISEFLIEAMEENNLSVRKLANKAGVSPTTIQNLKSGINSNVSIHKLVSILSVLNYRIEFKKNSVAT